MYSNTKPFRFDKPLTVYEKRFSWKKSVVGWDLTHQKLDFGNISRQRKKFFFLRINPYWTSERVISPKNLILGVFRAKTQKCFFHVKQVWVWLKHVDFLTSTWALKVKSINSRSPGDWKLCSHKSKHQLIKPKTSTA